MAATPEYIALGPVYPTILKKMKWAPQGLERISAWKRRLAPSPLVAIGGLNPDRLDGVFEAGADTAAMVTDIMLNDDPEARTLASAIAAHLANSTSLEDSVRECKRFIFEKLRKNAAGWLAI